MRTNERVESGGLNQRPSASAESPRYLAIDRLRGVLIILMVAGDYLAGVQIVPAFLKHAPDIGLTIADTVAPAFVFVIGLNFRPSFLRRVRQGTGPAYRHFLLRYLALIGIGAVISAGQTIAEGVPTGWGVLQALGTAGLICLVFIRFPAWARFAIGLLMLVGYQYVLDTWMLTSVLSSSHGGFFGAVSWAALLVLSTAVTDVWGTGLRRYAISCAALVVVAVIAAAIVPVSKNRVSVSFILITLAISAIAFLIADLASRLVAQRAGFLCWWGENPLALYLLHLMALALVVLPPATWWYAEASAGLAAFQLIVLLAALSLIAWWLHRRRLAIGL